LLGLLGDVGGLIDAMRYLGYLLVTPVLQLAVRRDVMSSLFYKRQSRDEKDVEGDNLEDIEANTFARDVLR